MNPLLKASTALKPGGEKSSATNQKTLTEQEQKLLKMYGNLPTPKALLGQKLKERKYFDSGDYALSKAGKTTAPVGSQHPQPENIPHSNISAATSASGSASGFPGGVHHGSPPPRESLLIYEQL
ncbi:hypothetical protein EMPS_07940 [Entomortierella parvispora]|uniref:mRNA stability protein n=1 Tax=Entomortierella parvispora TaxID=205924 RepID=A0A9P3HFC2_9FUNG|nr:hypothetical protein EMPS_07940 [Entomortierella parvispora]